MSDAAGMAMREAFAQFPQGVVLIAAEINGEPQGLVASSFMVGVSLDPPLVAVAVQHTSTTWPVLREADRLGVSLIGADHMAVTRQLASPQRDERFDGIDYVVDEAGGLHLSGTPAWLTTTLHDVHPAGDHDMVLLEVLEAGSDVSHAPVVFHQREFKQLAR